MNIGSKIFEHFYTFVYYGAGGGEVTQLSPYWAAVHQQFHSPNSSNRSVNSVIEAAIFRQVRKTAKIDY
jgi:hypothetical protein